MPALDSLKIHWRAPLQTKGFLRIIEFFLAILAFSLVAGFSFQGHVHCKAVSNDTDVTTVHFKYPFSSYSFRNGSTTAPLNKVSLGYGQAHSGAQLFVTWGVLSMIYAVVALVVYMVFTANESWEKVVDFLVYTDLAFNIAWVLCWFIAFVEWTVAFRGLRSYVEDTVMPSFELNVPGCGSDDLVNTSVDTFEQAAIASVFGFLCLAVWGASIWWVLIDTAVFIKWRAGRQQLNYSTMG